MKELSIEEKAKAYDEALESIKELYSKGSRVVVSKEEFETIFPKLRESEDEKVRKALINVFATHKDYEVYFGVSVKDIRAWLEKQGKKSIDDLTQQEAMDIAVAKCFEQGEQKSNPCDGCVNRKGCINCENGDMKETEHKVEPKFKVGDWITHNRANFIFKIINVGSNGYEVVNRENYKKTISFDNEDNYHLWTIQDAKEGDVLCYKDEVLLYKHDIKDWKETSFGGIVYYCCYDGKRFITDSFYSLTEQDKIDIHPATKEQRDLLFSKMKEAGYEWDTEKKELRKIEHTSAWTKEDEAGLGDALWAIERARTTVKNENEMGNLWYAERWLKSIKKKMEEQ